DIGGGSVEFIVGNADRPELLLSAKLGSTRLAELFLKSDPPSIGEMKRLRRHLEDRLETIFAKIGRRTFARCIATSGTDGNIASVLSHRRDSKDADSGQLRITRQQLKDLSSELAVATREERARLPGIDAQRLDSILPGTLLLHLVLKSFDLPGIDYCDMALR